MASKMDAYHEVSAPRGGGKKKLDHLLVRPAKNKGHVVEHHYDNSTGDGIFVHRPDVHAFGEGPEVIHHLMDHLGVKENEMLESMQSGHEGMDEEEPGGKGENDELAKAPNPKHKGKSKGEMKGDD